MRKDIPDEDETEETITKAKLSGKNPKNMSKEGIHLKIPKSTLQLLQSRGATYSFTTKYTR